MAILLRLSVKAHDTLQDYVTVLHFTSEDADTSPEDCASGFGGDWVNALRGTLVTSGHMDSVTATEILPPGDTGTPREFTKALVDAGTYDPGTDDLPQAICGLVNLHTDVASRRARGWTYGYPMMGSGNLESLGERIDHTSAYWDALVNLAAQSSQDTTGVDTAYHPVVFSRAGYLADAGYYFRITSGVASNKPRFLRKRSLIH